MTRRGLTMSSIIEKITLYDFFGYLIPGSLFASLLCLRALPEFGNQVLEELQGYETECLVLFLLWGFLFGLLLSETARIILDFIDKVWLEDKYAERIRKVAHVDTSALINAIQKSGITETPLTGEGADPLKYLPAVYGIVQSDEAYKRIHNYASSETMYKNLSAAVLFGGLIEILYLIHTVQATWSCGIIAVWLLSVALLMHRYYRFKIKKYAYSLIWFIEKYQSTTVVNEQ